MKGNKECDEHNCEALKYCKWHPDECQGKPWEQTDLKIWQRILRPSCFGKEAKFPGCGMPGKCPFNLEVECATVMLGNMTKAGEELIAALKKARDNGQGS